ncbi:Glycosyltransferase involved in cell wall bisynthesis [Selenomonas sp. WCT3]|nr:Glycosyltransferase involved in cell wall bisynthesis [Selenomonas ruminantium]
MVSTISVVMSVYNGERYLSEAIDSILNQSYDDFEFIIIDDCSTDNSVDIIKSYNDNRIRLVRNEENLRLPASLNKGIKLASGKYIARMDADDISLMDRFSKQVKYLEEHPEVTALGGSFQVIDCGGCNLYKHHALTDEKLERYYLIPSPLAHPTVMMRRETIIDNNLFYDERYSSAQDYDLWLRIRKQFKIANLPDVLLKYRIHKKSISTIRAQEQQNNTYDIFSKNSPVDVTYDECMAILHRSYTLYPWQQAFAMYRVFHTLDYIYWRNVVGYTVRYIMDKFNLNKSTAV